MVWQFFWALGFPQWLSSKESTCSAGPMEAMSLHCHVFTWVQFLGQEDPLEKEMATHSSVLAQEILWTEEPVRLQSMGSQELDTTKQRQLGTRQYWYISKSLSRVRLFVTPRTAAHQASLSITNFQSLLKPMSIKLVMPSNHLILCRALLLPPPVFPSIRGFSNESALHIRWPKYCSFSFNISPSSEHPGLISFKMDWLDLLAVQGTLKSLLQHHSSKASLLQCSAFFMVQLSHPYMTTG